ncbi:MAG TPA: regulatory protein RecX [Acidiferrobacteraceae bacterium]|nr:regulatory protein RecX [Acidiferrobacteraceae bacterium]
MDMLGRREHGCRELLAKLIKKGFDPDQANMAIEGLVADNLLSDQRFAEALFRVRCRKGYGPVRIAMEMREKGLVEELIEQWVDFSHPDWLNYAAEVYQKKYCGAVPQDYREQTKRMRFLQQRGFTREQINQTIQPYMCESC